jgi:hypothetical protein
MNKNVVIEIDLGSQSGSRTSFATTYYSNKLFVHKQMAEKGIRVLNGDIPLTPIILQLNDFSIRHHC